MTSGKPTDTRSLRQRGNFWFIHKRLTLILAKRTGKKTLQQSTQTGGLDEACRIHDRLLAHLNDLEAQLQGEASQVQQQRMFLQARGRYRETADSLVSTVPRDPVSLTEIMNTEKLAEVEQDAFKRAHNDFIPAH